MTVRVEARGMRCPWPAVRLARALRTAPQEREFEVRADDPAAASEMRIVAETNGAALSVVGPNHFRIVRL
ncbi:sulfurtransferase TusA family protein [Stakelama saccharophila]|uniref:Sulfurtransferase TusA family protein n=1 Tax=Stakelama saccharophila TaxID=3075605 RepID=A0ABZ0BCU2_9SPHN|nr:sulfurtransferase TusA family protein [Stakelama sp. W311]WNO54895.1 sulfurtransferase TusA family protein [Stakelama sp. W311]